MVRCALRWFRHEVVRINERTLWKDNKTGLKGRVLGVKNSKIYQYSAWGLERELIGEELSVLRSVETGKAGHTIVVTPFKEVHMMKWSQNYR